MNDVTISSLVPHQGGMCLLDEVLACDGERIVCRATSHRSRSNPLRDEAGLSAIAAIEYGAQAVAVHGAMMNGDKRTHGMLAAAREVVLGVERLDDIEDDLEVSAQRLIEEGDKRLYEFALHAGGRELVRGRVAIALGAGERDA